MNRKDYDKLVTEIHDRNMINLYNAKIEQLDAKIIELEAKVESHKVTMRSSFNDLVMDNKKCAMQRLRIAFEKDDKMKLNND